MIGQDLFHWLQAEEQDMISLVEAWAQQNSGTEHIAGCAQQSLMLQRALSSLGGIIEEHEPAEVYKINDHGDAVLVPIAKSFSLIKNPDASKQVLLMGHMDTVFSVEHPFQEIRYLEKNILNGPGVADMKGGLVVMLYALKAFEQSPYANQIGYRVLINADEETGSLGSSALFSRFVDGAQLGLVYEPAMDDKGTLAGARSGSGKFTAVFRGIAAHAGRAFASGRNAIVASAEWIAAVHQLNGQRPGVTLNIGLIKGGVALNVVPDLTIVRVDVRTKIAEDETWVHQQLEQISARVYQSTQVSVELHGHFGRKPKPLEGKTLALFEWVKSIGKRLNLNLDWQPSGGCCDGNNLSALGLPTIDTLGVRGGKIHSAEEYLCIDSLVERAWLSANLLMEFAQKQEV